MASHPVTSSTDAIYMDYLRNLGSAAASSLLQKSGIALPFALGEKVISFEGKSIWSLYDGVKRVSLGYSFVIDSTNQSSGRFKFGFRVCI